MEKIVLALDSRDIGGIETHVLILAGALNAAGHAATVLRIADHGPHPMDAAASGHGVDVRVLPHEGGNLPAWLKRNGISLLHTHGYKAGILGRMTRPLHCRPVVSTFHNGDRGSGKLALYTATDRLTARMSHNIAVSREIAGQLPGTPTVIDNFVDVPPPDCRPQGRCVGFVGRLSHEKGPDLFVELARRLPDIDFVMFGGGPMQDELSRGLPVNLTMAGSVPGMDRHWRCLSLLVMPSRQEGLPMAALEAMAHGVPVAAFGVGGLPDLIGDGVDGYLARPGDMDALARTVFARASSTDAERRAMSQAARETIRRCFSAEAQLTKVLEVYARALGREL
ncbi:MAG: glycosyltransferase family 4 protein [Minwuia sp.]|uniref:glycosyltransferase family 4 protein n=1 Tax=Minwuia sp. TaxID=2493630 RepID=UPI003A88D790